MSHVQSREVLAALADQVFSKIDAVRKTEAVNSASVTMRRFEGSDVDAVTIALDPARAGAPAVFHLVQDAPFVMITVGRGGSFEIAIGGTPNRPGAYSDLSFESEIAEFTRAIVRGHVREEVWFQGNRIVKDRCSVRLGDRWVTSVRYIGGNLLRRRRKVVINWDPYDGQEDAPRP